MMILVLDRGRILFNVLEVVVKLRMRNITTHNRGLKRGRGGRDGGVRVTYQI